ncbi:MAG: tRNA (adenosine(37)-N6)-threonylcarbamoyltransferase complex ATPase subunit type 1 TsaE [Ottowia sp.]|nr:tRNA (adenosine(37)-N6)-threonylcarbamoyltransferase complex ATPase subunit type 1 TsaE [Ottowia sp.]
MTAVHEEIVETAPLALQWADEAACARFAARLATCPEVRGAFIALEGELGAGKTSFVRHLLRALGVAGTIKSPTYAIMEGYDAPDGLPIAHFDFYRFDDPREWEDAGLRDAFAAAGLKLAEWPEKAAGLLPTADLVLHIRFAGGDARDLQLFARSALGERILGALRDENHA